MVLVGEAPVAGASINDVTIFKGEGSIILGKLMINKGHTI